MMRYRINLYNCSPVESKLIDELTAIVRRGSRLGSEVFRNYVVAGFAFHCNHGLNIQSDMLKSLVSPSGEAAMFRVEFTHYKECSNDSIHAQLMDDLSNNSEVNRTGKIRTYAVLGYMLLNGDKTLLNAANMNAGNESSISNIVEQDKDHENKPSHDKESSVSEIPQAINNSETNKFLGIYSS